MGTLLSQFSMSHMPNLVFISAPELVPLTHTKGDLVLQAGLNGAPQHLPLKNWFKDDHHVSEDRRRSRRCSSAAAANVVTLLTPWTPPSSWSPLSCPSPGPPWSQTCSL